MAANSNQKAKGERKLPNGVPNYVPLTIPEYERLLNELDNKKRREAEKAIQQQS